MHFNRLIIITVPLLDSDCLSLLEEKARLLCMSCRWSEAQVVAKQIITTTPNSIPARRVLIVGTLLHQKRTPEDATLANDLVTVGTSHLETRRNAPLVSLVDPN
jgi:hypothetical protein